jgi:hypothetical protein
LTDIAYGAMLKFISTAMQTAAKHCQTTGGKANG